MPILYTPIDIEFQLPNEQELHDWIDKYKTTDTTHWTYDAEYHDWAFIATRYNSPNWQNFDLFRSWQANRTIDPALPYININPTIKDCFPDLKLLLDQLPFKQIGVAGFLRQKNPMPLHYDTPDFTNPTEPRRYIVYMTDPKFNTFFMNDGHKDYDLVVNDKYRVVAFDSVGAKHGTKIQFGPKIIMSIVGILDHDKHDALLKRSLEKFKDQVGRSD